MLWVRCVTLRQVSDTSVAYACTTSDMFISYRTRRLRFSTAVNCVMTSVLVRSMSTSLDRLSAVEDEGECGGDTELLDEANLWRALIQLDAWCKALRKSSAKH